MAAGGLARYTWRRNFHRRHFSYADSRSERPAQGLHDALWRRVGRGAQKRQFQRGKRRIRRHHGRIRLRQDHAPEHPRRARQADLRPGAARRQGPRVRSASPTVPPSAATISASCFRSSTCSTPSRSRTTSICRSCSRASRRASSARGSSPSRRSSASRSC